MSPRSCVVTVNFHGSTDTARCVASVESSDTPADIVVVDNTPNDPNLAEALAAFAKVEILRSPRNLGFGAGCNLGIGWALAETDCAFVLILHNDTVLEPEALGLMEGVMDEHPEAGIIAPRVVFMDDPGKLYYCGRGYIDWRTAAARMPGFGGGATGGRALGANYTRFASGSAMLVRREVLNQVGGFDEIFFLYEEDVDLSLRVIEAGYRIWYCPEAAVRHKVRGSRQRAGSAFYDRWSGSNPGYELQVYHTIRNSIINVRRHARGVNLLKFLCVYPVFVTYKTVLAARKRGFRAFAPVLRGLAAGLRQPLSSST